VFLSLFRRVGIALVDDEWIEVFWFTVLGGLVRMVGSPCGCMVGGVVFAGLDRVLCEL